MVCTLLPFRSLIPEGINLPAGAVGCGCFRSAFLLAQCGCFRSAFTMVVEHRAEYPSEWAMMTAVAGMLGMTPETLRNWVRQAE
ncbi:MAG: hypothetical protein WCL38_03855, partial [Actinomycetota bacterium]